tara:strand:- start:763 stop:1263 length:501 start_codon:yes stop_codon:yes gene_type:complete
MSAQFFQQSTPSQNTFARCFNINCDEHIETSSIQSQKSIVNSSLTINGNLEKRATKFIQQTNATTNIDVNFNNNVWIETKTFTTPHSSNNTTSFLLQNFTGFTLVGTHTVINMNLVQYLGTTGQPILTGKRVGDYDWEITIINVHQNQDLNGIFFISGEKYYLKEE